MSTQISATLARPPERVEALRAAPWTRARSLLLAVWRVVSEPDAWTPTVDRVADHPEWWFRI
jgi:hypothetical protein